MLHLINLSLFQLYIPLWYDSNVNPIPSIFRNHLLYIPLWYDSNDGRTLSYTVFLRSFTFHSGTILIKISFGFRIKRSIFTFHSGTILIRQKTYMMTDKDTFTFHSGTILMCQCLLCLFCQCFFTFHSGTILIVSLPDV